MRSNNNVEMITTPLHPTKQTPKKAPRSNISIFALYKGNMSSFRECLDVFVYMERGCLRMGKGGGGGWGFRRVLLLLYSQTAGVAHRYKYIYIYGWFTAAMSYCNICEHPNYKENVNLNESMWLVNLDSQLVLETTKFGSSNNILHQRSKYMVSTTYNTACSQFYVLECSTQLGY